MPTVETAEEFVDYIHDTMGAKDYVALLGAVSGRDAEIRIAELARVVKRLRDEAARGRELQRENACDGPLYARWKWHADSCGFAADLLEREGAWA